jgi:tetratricopeptide (TPR) repeat protein
MKLASFPKFLMASLFGLVLVSGVALAQGKDQSKPKSLYPNATRTAPKLDLTKQSDADQLNKGLKALHSGDTATAKQILQPFADGKASKSKYVQALALQGLANLAYKAGHVDKAIPMLQKALALNVMPNDTYFQLQYELAQFYLIHGDYQKSLDTVEEWRKAGKRETADSYGLEGKNYYQLGQYKQAIVAMKKAISMTDKPQSSWNQVLAASYAETGNTDEALKSAREQLAKNPDDMTTLHNTVSLLVGAGKYSDAMDLMTKAEGQGNFKDAKDYITLAKLHLMKAQDEDHPKAQAQAAVATVKRGISKGMVKPGFKSHKIEGDAAYLQNDIKGAIAAYSQAAKTAPDGRMSLQLAKLQLSERHFSAGRSAAREALKQGLKHEGEAYEVIAESERAMNNRSAAVRAMRKAEKDPTTHDKAKAWLRKAGH